MLSKTSKSTLRMAYKAFKNEGNNLKVKIQQDEKNLRATANNYKYNFVINKVKKNCEHVRNKIKKAKERKLINLEEKQRLVNNNGNEKQVENEKGNFKHKRNRRKINNKRKRSAKSKRRRRKEKMKRKELELIDKLKDIEMPSDDRFKPFDNTGYRMSDTESQVCAKGLKLVASIKRIKRHKKDLDFGRFARLLRLVVYHHRRGNDQEFEQHPWTPKSLWEPQPYINRKLEEYLDEVYNELFSLENTRRVPDNMTPEQREALRNLSEWNQDDSNPRMFRVQDKGARLFIEWKERYGNKVEDYLEDTRIFREEDHDTREENKVKVTEWAEKWYNNEVISSEMRDWIIPEKVKPGNVYANPKAHKEHLPYRFIISARGSATEKLARWTEIQLKNHSRKHKAYLKDTTDSLKFVEDVNIRKGPMDELTTVLTTRDIENYYPSCDTEKCLKGIEQVLGEDECCSESYIQCIVEAVRLTMTSNNCSFLGRHFTQIDGATIGGPDAGSVTDLFGAIYIDKVIQEECPFDVEEYKRYRDDTADINTNNTIEQQKVITDWLNENVYKGKIKFKLDCDPKLFHFWI